MWGIGGDNVGLIKSTKVPKSTTEARHLSFFFFFDARQLSDRGHSNGSNAIPRWDRPSLAGLAPPRDRERKHGLFCRICVWRGIGTRFEEPLEPLEQERYNGSNSSQRLELLEQ